MPCTVLDYMQYQQKCKGHCGALLLVSRRQYIFAKA